MKTDRRILSQYTNEDGLLVTVYKPRKPRQSEKTWIGGSKFSLASIGGKGATLRNKGMAHAKG
jgi:hypothetical protein